MWTMNLLLSALYHTCFGNEKMPNYSIMLVGLIFLKQFTVLLNRHYVAVGKNRKKPHKIHVCNMHFIKKLH